MSTSQDFNEEYRNKERRGILHTDVEIDDVAIRVFQDGTAYAHDGHRGKYQKVAEEACWEYYRVDGTVLKYSHKEYDALNLKLSEAWLSLPQS